MKNSATFLLFGLLCLSLQAQNPQTKRTNYTYDFGTDSYILSSEFLIEYNELEQPVYNTFTRWYTWQDSLIVEKLFDQSSTYHPDGSIASILKRDYDGDTLRSANYTEYDIYGNQIKDSAYYRQSEEVVYINVARSLLVYDDEGRYVQRQEQIWSNDQPQWFNSSYRKYEYNSNGCLVKTWSGVNAAEIYNRTTNTYTDDCTPLSTFSERWDFNSFQWVNSSQFTWEYTAGPDSSREERLSQNWDVAQGNWVTESESEIVFDGEGRRIRTFSKDKNGRQTRTSDVYNVAGENIYSVSSTRPFSTATWANNYEYELLESSELRTKYSNKFGWDTLRNAYRYYAVNIEEVDEQGRPTLDTRIDSSWNGTEYIRKFSDWRNAYENYCDGLTHRQITKRGEEGLSPQPVSRTDFSYLYKADCESFGEEFSMMLAPNPASDFMILESDLLQSAEVKVQIIDHMGRTIFSDAPGERQSRYYVPIQSLQKGTYFLRLVSPSQSMSKSFVKY